MTTSTSQVQVDPEFAGGLQDIEGFSHLILIYLFHRSTGYALQVKPFLDDTLHGVFSTRYPARPNPIGISVVKLVSRQGYVLEIEGGGESSPNVDVVVGLENILPSIIQVAIAKQKALPAEPQVQLMVFADRVRQGREPAMRGRVFVPERDHQGESFPCAEFR